VIAWGANIYFSLLFNRFLYVCYIDNENNSSIFFFFFFFTSMIQELTFSAISSNYIIII
jgi:hypothetical protein